MEKDSIDRRIFESINDVGAIRLRWTAAHSRQALPLHYANELIYRKGGESQCEKGEAYQRVVCSFIGVSSFIEGGIRCVR